MGWSHDYHRTTGLTRDAFGNAGRNGNWRLLQGNLAGVHGTQTLDAHLTGIEFFFHGLVAIRGEDQLGGDMARNGSVKIETQRKRIVGGSIGDAEVLCREVSAFGAKIQGIGFDELRGGNGRQQEEVEAGKEREKPHNGGLSTGGDLQRRQQEV